LEEDEIKRGNIVCNNLNYCLESQEFKAVVTVVELPEQKKLLSNGYEGIIHIHAVSENI
jgi:translation elongation factor EF-1alpha